MIRTWKVATSAAVLLMVTSSAGASSARMFSVTNIIACTSSGPNLYCGPPNEMKEGGGNGTFPSGLALIKDGESRIWIADHTEPSTASLGTRGWTLDLGGTSLVTRLTWTVGDYEWATETFTPASGTETVVTSAGSTSFTPSSSLTIPSGRYIALRVTGASGNAAPSFIDIYDENGGLSPSSLTLGP